MLPSLLATRSREINDKCQELRVNIARMWNKNTNVIPVVTGEKGSILNSLENHLKNIGTSPNITTLQKYVLVGEAQIL